MADGKNLRNALTEALVNAVTMFTLTFGLLVLGKQSGQLATDIGLRFILLQATAVGFLRFATYMYANEDDVTPGQALEQMLPSMSVNEEENMVKTFCRRHPIAKLI
jgi:hypothetical protein